MVSKLIKSQTNPKIDALVCRFAAAAPGSIVDFSEILAILDSNNLQSCRQMIQRARLRLVRKHGVHIENVQRVGYKKLAAGDGVDWVRNKGRLRTYRSGKMNIAKLDCIDRARLTNDEKGSHSLLRSFFSIVTSSLHLNSVKSNEVKIANGNKPTLDLSIFKDIR